MARKRKAKKKTMPFHLERFIRPTAEREAHNDFDGAGAAVRSKRPIRDLFDRDKLTPSQFDSLDHYRAQAQQAQDDEGETSPQHPEKAMGGVSGGHPGSKIPASLLRASPAQLETSRIEREVLRYGQDRLDLLRFVVRDEQTLAAWCIHKHGGRERYDAKGRFVALVPKAEKRVMAEALLDLKYIAGTIVK